MVVIGLGNRALCDDGVASRVICAVARKAPAGVEVVDAALPGPGLIHLLEAREKAILVDAVDAGGRPGTVYRFGPNDVASNQPDRPYSLHQGDVLQYLKLAEALGMSAREVVVVGVQPESFSPGQKLSPAVEAAVAEAAELAIAETDLTRQAPAVHCCVNEEVTLSSGAFRGRIHNFSPGPKAGPKSSQ